MSADNYYCVSQDPDTERFIVWMGFASCEGSDFGPTPDDPSFKTELDAIHYAMEQYSEYGVSTVEWPGWFEYDDDDDDDDYETAYGMHVFSPEAQL